MQVEREFTFTVIELPSDYKEFRSVEIIQGYFSNGEDALRIRKIGSVCELTKKTPLEAGNFGAFTEETIVIKLDEFELIWPKVKKHVKKTRYFYPIDQDHICEIDLYQGELKGLVLAEVEFMSNIKMKDFAKPTWLGKDVTQEKWPSPEFLAGKTFFEVRELINK